MFPPLSSYPKRRLVAFSLVEMAVAAGVIGLMVVLLMPAMRESFEQARASKCIGNLRSLGVAFQMYAGENDGTLPPSYVVGSNGADNNWWYRVSPYTQAKAMEANWGDVAARSMGTPFHCPLVKNPDPSVGNNAWVSYKMNVRFRHQSAGSSLGIERGAPLARIAAPANALLVSEGRQHPEFDRYLTDNIPWGLWYPHRGTLNGLFVDGHVETLSQSALAERWEEIAQNPLGE